MDNADRRQLAYYESTADEYSDTHVTPGDEHFIALEYVLGLLTVTRSLSLLDVGSGTGRAVRFLQSRRPDLNVVGLEPSPALRAHALAQGGDFVEGDGRALPFPAESFDVVLATGVLHHVADPVPLVAEMARVARRAVIISDSNRFGQGGRLIRAVKPLVFKTGLWPVFERVRTRGRGYMESDGDGIFYSYSVYDSLPQLTSWGTRTFVIPTSGNPSGWSGPFLGSTHAMLASIREPTEGWAGT